MLMQNFKLTARLYFAIFIISMVGCLAEQNNPTDPKSPNYINPIVVYKSNGAVSGVVPVDNKKYEIGNTVTVLGNTGNLVRNGFYFIGWNTKKDGNGTVYVQGSTFSIGNKKVILYAMWTDAPVVTNLTFVSGSGQVSLSWVDPATVEFDHVAITWSPAEGMNQPVTVAKGTQSALITGLSDGASYTFSVNSVDAAGNVLASYVFVVKTLVASNLSTYTVTYNGNGNSGGYVPFDSNNYEQGVTVTVLGNIGNLIKVGYIFVGWNTQADGSGSLYSQGTAFTIGSANVTLYAMWIIPSTNAFLAGIIVSHGKLQPSFAAGTTSYLDAPIPYTNNTATITPTLADSNATIKVDGTTVVSGNAVTKSLVVGANNVNILVTAQDGVTTKTYTVCMYRAVPVFKTGQTTSYQTGDDGDSNMQWGAPWSTPRFAVSGNTVTDNNTGLMWIQSPPTGTYTWTGAFTYIEDLNSAVTYGYNDWRMPNVRELASLVDFGQNILSTWLNGQGFSNVQSNWYYSSTTYAPSITSTRIVLMVGGYMGDGNKSDGRYVWPVRENSINIMITGQTTQYNTNDDGQLKKGTDFPSTRFCNNDDGTVTDNMTGLMWVQSPPTGTYTWVNGFTYINGLNNANAGAGTYGYNDWRFPNVEELKNLVNYGQSDSSTWLNAQGFSNVQTNYYWSSTTFANSNTRASVVGMSNSYVSDINKTTPYCVWPVRGGQR